MHDGLTREQIRETRRAIQRALDGKPEPKAPPTDKGTVLLVTNSTYPPGRNQSRVFRAGSKWIGEGGTYWEDSDLLEDYITWEVIQ